MRIGSRGSALALTQSRYVQGLLEGHGIRSEIEIIKTRGDIIQDMPLSAVADERKGFFTKEIEEALLEKRVDLAVHSYKDMPTAEVPGLCIACIPERKSARELLLVRKSAVKTDRLPFLEKGQVLGTSSERRKAQVEHFWPELTVRDLRGNVPTRLNKLKNGLYDAILLAEAGLVRLRENSAIAADELTELKIIPLSVDFFVPAPAQGALALQCRIDDQNTINLLEKLHRPEEAASVATERKILKELEGGCHLPLGAHFHVETDHARAWIFLGKSAKDNRTGRSFTMERQARNSEELSRIIELEIKKKLPIILTGRQDRITELNARRALLMPLIEIEEIGAGPEQFMAWLKADRKMIALFSAPAAKHLSEWLVKQNLTLPEADFICTGQQTRQAIQDNFPGARISIIASDGTGQSLAEELNIAKEGAAILVAGAQEKQGGFQKFIDPRFSVFDLPLYRTIQRTLSEEEKDGFPEQALVVLASPSAAQAFFLSWENQKRPAGLIYCAIGPSTARSIAEAGELAYIIARGRDYQSLLQEPFFAP